MLRVEDVVVTPEFPEAGRVFAIDAVTDTVLIRFPKGLRTQAIKVVPLSSLVATGGGRWAFNDRRSPAAATGS